MVDGTIQLPGDSTGKILDTSDISFGAGSTSRHRERIVIGDPLSTTGLATVTSSAGLQTTISSGTVTLSSAHTITATAATNPWSSAPGFNVPIISASSGFIQISSGSVTLSSQHTVTATGPVTVTSGLISITSGTITSTAGTNPWSSAPGFNVPIISASSGLIQISGVPKIVISSSGGATPTFVAATTVSKISSSPAVLYGINVFSTLATLVFARVYDATTSSVVVGTSVKMVFPCGLYSTAATAPTFGAAAPNLGPSGVNFLSGISFDGVATTTSTAAVVTSVKLTAVFV